MNSERIDAGLRASICAIKAWASSGYFPVLIPTRFFHLFSKPSGGHRLQFDCVIIQGPFMGPLNLGFSPVYYPVKEEQSLKFGSYLLLSARPPRLLKWTLRIPAH